MHPMRPSRYISVYEVAAWLLVGFALLILFGCSDPTGRTDPPPPPPPPTRLALTHVEGTLTLGGTATVVGTALADSLHTLTLDGAPVEIVSKQATRATFRVPAQLRACETDGRRLTLQANGSPAHQVQATLRVEGTLSLAVGQTRVLDAADLDCLRLPADGSEYVLTAFNDHPTIATRVDPLLTLQTFGAAAGSADPAQALPAITGRATPFPAHAHGHDHGNFGAQPTAPHALSRQNGIGDLPGGYSSNPKLFDPRYATAGVGDTVLFLNSNAHGCIPEEGRPIPTYRMRIVALAGKTVIAVDLDNVAHADQYFQPEIRAAYQQIAEIVDPLILPTMRAIFDEHYQMNPAAGGRHFHVLRGTGANASFGATNDPQSRCPLASEMIATSIGSNVVNLGNPLNVRAIAATIIHEYAHNAERISAHRIGLPGTINGPLPEAWANLAEETSMRIASGQLQDARLQNMAGNTPYGAPFTTLWGAHGQYSAQLNRGGYTHGMYILTLMRDRIGEWNPAKPGERAWQRIALAGGQMDAVARELGVSTDSLMAQWTLSTATAALLAPEAADAAGIWRMTSWNMEQFLSTGIAPRGGPNTTDRTVGRAASTSRLLEAAPSAYAAAYFFADADPQGNARGVSLRISPTETPSILRITRLR